MSEINLTHSRDAEPDSSCLKTVLIASQHILDVSGVDWFVMFSTTTVITFRE